MADREKVIKAIEICIGNGHCSKCGYHLSDYHAAAHDCRDQMMQDALELLKEQKEKAGKWIPVTNGRGGMECSICHDYAPSYQNGTEYLSTYCPNCGAKMEGR